MARDKKPLVKKPRQQRKARQGRKKLQGGMDSKIWKDLPIDLVDSIVARVPIATLFRFSLVCQKWNTYLFRKQLEVLGPRNLEPLFLAIKYGVGEKTGAIYEHCLKTWRHSTPLPKLVFGFLAASGGGLVCYLNCGEYWTFHIGNPLTDTWKEMHFSPQVSYISPIGAVSVCAVGIVFLNQDSSPPIYNVIVLKNGGLYGIYDSTTPNTVITGILPPTICLPSFLTYGTVTIGTTIYFLGLNPCRILMYDAKTRAWDQLLVQPPLYATDLCLAECNGRILLLGMVKGTRACYISIRVWEYQKESIFGWIDLSRMPKSMSSELIGKDNVCFRCHGNQGMLVMSLWNYRMTRFFSYDSVTREWSTLPAFYPPGYRRRQHISSGVNFVPSLTAAP